MIIEHLSDTQIQMVVFDKENSDPAFSAHLTVCPVCRSKAAFYEKQFVSVSGMGKPVFDFNLQELVLARLSKPQKKTRTISYFFILGALLLVPAFAGFWVFRKYLYNMFSGFSTMMIYFLAFTALTFLVFQIIEMNGRFRRKLNALNYY